MQTAFMLAEWYSARETHAAVSAGPTLSQIQARQRYDNQATLPLVT